MYQSIVVSDLHLSDAEHLDPGRPLWKLYKRRELFFDAEFVNCIRHIEDSYSGPTELILNGDIFDFDNILQLPESPEGEINWLAHLRGLGTEEWMSSFKAGCIIRDHPEFFSELGEFLNRGNRIVFITGNHDLEICWPSVRDQIYAAMNLEEGSKEWNELVFCDWFYVSEGDTYVSHGHQYDGFCVVRDPIYPFIQIGGKPQVRMPFGEMAERYILNGMGYFNPHATSNFIMGLGEYVRFFFKYMLRTQPFLIWSWFWGAMVSLFLTFNHFIRPPMKDPLKIEERTAEVARASQVSPDVVRKLKAVSVASACSNPIRIIRELWLDRALLFLGMLYLGFQFMATINLVWRVSPLVALIPILLLSPLFFVYSFSVNSGVFTKPLLNERRAALISEITGTKRVVFGHSHIPEARQVGGVTYYNSGFWSPAYAEPECINRIGQPTFVWIRVEGDNQERSAELLAWPPGTSAPEALPL